MQKVDVRSINKKLKDHPILTRFLMPFYILAYAFLYTALLLWENWDEAKRELVFAIKVMIFPWRK